MITQLKSVYIARNRPKGVINEITFLYRQTGQFVMMPRTQACRHYSIVDAGVQALLYG